MSMPVPPATPAPIEPFATPPNPPTARARWWMAVLWPAFLMAGVAEMLVFAVVDPQDLRWFGGERINWSREAIYTVTFFIFWSLTTLSSCLSVLLTLLPDGQDPLSARARGHKI